MFNKARYFRNILLNWGAYFASLLIGFLIAPRVVSGLGDDYFGYWTLILTATAYFARLDFGLQSAVAQYISRHLADQNKDQLNDKANSALLILTLIGFAALVPWLAASSLFTAYFKLSPQAAPAVKTALIFMSLAAATKLPFSVFQAMLIGKERFDIMSGVSIGIKILSAFLIIMVLRTEQRLVGLSIAIAGTQIGEGLIWYWFARRAIPDFKIRPSRFKIAAIRELYQYGAFNFLIILSSQIGSGFWAFMLGRKLGADSITHFSIGYEVIPYMIGMANAATLPLLQAIIPMDVKEDEAAIRKTFITGSRYFFAFICLLGLNLLLVGESFIGRWMGVRFLDPFPYGSSGTVLILLTLANMASLSSSVAQQILFARRKNQVFAYLSLLQTASIIVLSLTLVPRFGLMGMAVAMLIPLVIIEGIIIPVLASKYSFSGMADYWRNAIFPNLWVAGLVYGVGRLVLPYFPGSGWPLIFLSFALVSLMHIMAVGAFIIGKHDRAALYVQAHKRFALVLAKENRKS